MPQVAQLLCGDVALGLVTSPLLSVIEEWHQRRASPAGLFPQLGRIRWAVLSSLFLKPGDSGPEPGWSEGSPRKPLLSCPWPGSFLRQKARVSDAPCSGRAGQKSVFPCGLLVCGRCGGGKGSFTTSPSDPLSY